MPSTKANPSTPQLPKSDRKRLRTALEHLADFPRAGRVGQKLGSRKIVLDEYLYLIRYRLTAAGHVQ
jgi:plasmid stabilization system protein ParE